MILMDEALFIKIGQGFGKQVGEGREICICLPIDNDIFAQLYTATLITAKAVIPAKAGNPGKH